MNKRIAFVLSCALLAIGAIAGCVAFQEGRAPAKITRADPNNPLVPTANLATATTQRAVSLPPKVMGTVLDANGAVANAIVQWQGTPNRTMTGANGAFVMNGITGTNPITLTAWSPGNYIGWALLDPGAPDWNGEKAITIKMEPHFTADNFKSEGFSFEGVTGAKSCGVCHREYKEWKADAHSQSSEDVHFVTMYAGTDIQGRESQPIQYDTKGKILPPDPSLPNYGPGFRLDNPGRAGNCATCHTPLAARISNEKNCSWMGCHSVFTAEHSNGLLQPGAVPISRSDRALEGVNCEFCHQIGDVLLNAETKLPNTDRPGVLSVRLFRPPEGQNLFFGTMVDVTRQDSYLPLQSESKFCAACHYGVMGGVVGNDTVTGGTVVYSSYAEWLSSPYSNPKTGKTCQDCHMPKAKENFTVFPERAGIARDYFDFHNHQMPGIDDEQFLKNAVTMKSTAGLENNLIRVQVKVTNDKTGHNVPTDAVIRQMILVVQAFDGNGNALPLKQGPVNPDWAGNFAKTAGKTFSKVLEDKATGEFPTAAFWRPTNIMEDTRLAPMATDSTQYAFESPDGHAAKVRVRLVYRRAIQSLSEQKGWNDPDIVMAEETIQVSP